MEGLALILFFLTLIGIIANIILIIYSIIKKDFKYRPKKLSIVLVGFIVVFIGSTIFYGAVQTPESKAKYEANQKVKEEKGQKELLEKEQKADEAKLKEEELKAQQKEKGAADKSEVYKEDVKIKSEEEARTKTDEEEKIKKQAEEEDKIRNPFGRWNKDNTFNLEAKPNTNEAELEIFRKAKEDSDKYDETIIQDKLKFIEENANNPWKDNSIMEQFIYWGTVIDKNSKTTDKEKKVGYKAKSVVSFVYRNMETIQDAKLGQETLLKYIEKLK